MRVFFQRKIALKNFFLITLFYSFWQVFLLQYLDVYYTDSVKVKKTSETFALLVMNEYILNKRMNNLDQVYHSIATVIT